MDPIFDIFLDGFGAPWVSLGLLEALLGSFKSEKMPTVPRENHLFVNAVFWLFAALMALLGSSWSVLGGFGSRMGFPKFSNMLSKVCQKMIKKRANLGFQDGSQEMVKVKSPG